MSNCPARAGFTSATNGCAVRTRDHPRSRGVYTANAAHQGQPTGSSPLARGLPRLNAGRVRRQRIIPARAGFTYRCRRGHWYVQDHPRSRGVYSTPAFPASKNGGSSPLARGLLANSLPCGNHAGIIPARAGFTSHQKRKTLPRQDHPRSRGVYVHIMEAVSLMAGSSPLARGLPDSVGCPWWAARIIPARAGFTWVDCAVGAAPGDHPRSRGVYDLPSDIGVPFPGSSPLARGLRVSQDGHGAVRGIIPARAGFTHPQNHGGHQEPDHPRSRGVYFPRLPYCSSYVGSSPLARGLRACHASRHHQYGIIPARAGFTAHAADALVCA